MVYTIACPLTLPHAEICQERSVFGVGNSILSSATQMLIRTSNSPTTRTLPDANLFAHLSFEPQWGAPRESAMFVHEQILIQGLSGKTAITLSGHGQHESPHIFTMRWA